MGGYTRGVGSVMRRTARSIVRVVTPAETAYCIATGGSLRSVSFVVFTRYTVTAGSRRHVSPLFY